MLKLLDKIKEGFLYVIVFIIVSIIISSCVYGVACFLGNLNSKHNEKIASIKNQFKHTEIKTDIKHIKGFITVEHDGCEYVISTIVSNGYIVHKQNCKYCNKGK